MNDALYFFVEHCVKNRKTQYSVDNPIITQQAIESGIVQIVEGNGIKVYEINIWSDDFNENLLVFAEELLGTSLPLNIDDAFKFLEDFFKNIHLYNGNYLWSGARNMVLGLSSYVLQLLDNEGTDIRTFFESYLDVEKPSHLMHFELALLYAVAKKENIDELMDLITSILVISPNNYEVDEFLRNIGSLNKNLSQELYHHCLGQDQSVQDYFLSKILFGLKDNAQIFILNELKKLKKNNYHLLLFMLGRMTYKSSEEIYEADKLLNKIVITSRNSIDYCYYLCKLIGNSFIQKKLRNEYLQKLDSIIEETDKSLLSAIFHSITYSLEADDESKYALLHKYLNRTNDLSVIASFFYQIHDPKYLFHIISLLYQETGWRLPMNLVEDPLRHFWGTERIRTEELILNLFSKKSTSLLAVQIIFAGYLEPFPVNIKKGSTIQQMNAIDSMCAFPIFFEKLLPFLLPLRSSRIISIRDSLADKLSSLIIEAYGKALYDLIMPILKKNKKDLELRARLDQALLEYQQDMKEKESINEFNPNRNEKDLMNLYYRLKNENHSKMSKNARSKTSLASIVTQTIIVRGNSWKINDDEVRPLGKISVEAMVDRRAFIDPDYFEDSLNNFGYGD